MPCESDEPTANTRRPARKMPSQSSTVPVRFPSQPESLNTSINVNLVSQSETELAVPVAGSYPT